MNLNAVFIIHIWYYILCSQLFATFYKPETWHLIFSVRMFCLVCRVVSCTSHFYHQLVFNPTCCYVKDLCIISNKSPILNYFNEHFFLQVPCLSLHIQVQNNIMSRLTLPHSKLIPWFNCSDLLLATCEIQRVIRQLDPNCAVPD